jgi:hypothetical protein
MMMIKELSSQQDKDRFLVVVLYYGNYFLGSLYEQAGGLMNLYTDTKQIECCLVLRYQQ